MTNEERAEKLVVDITGDKRQASSLASVGYVLSFADAIRRECAENARNAIFDFGIGDKEHIYSPIIRKDLAAQLVERAIMGNIHG